MSKYLAVYFLDEIAEGVSFKSSNWPLHLTVVPPFSAGIDEDSLEKVLAAVDYPNQITLEVVGKSMLGIRHDIPVMEVRLMPALQSFHETLIRTLSELNVTHGSPKHIRKGFRPHITVQKSGPARPGQRILMDAVSLVGYPTDGTRKVLKHFPLSPA